MKNNQPLSRRDFLKMAGIHLAAVGFPYSWIDGGGEESQWPALATADLPPKVAAIIALTPEAVLDQYGYMRVFQPAGRYLKRTPLALTQWHLENQKPWQPLKTDRTWAIVLHWFGDKEPFDDGLAGYMRGFDGLRLVGEVYARTSAHFLVGAASPLDSADAEQTPVGIVQTQAPAPGGIPYTASHLRPIDILAHQERKQYFVRALYQLATQYKNLHCVLQDFFDGPLLDPNRSTIAIEICGYKFDDPEHKPGDQQIANVLAVVWAIMKRYRIQAVNILGHCEFQLGKADPGKKFLALIRYLIGVKALLVNDPEMNKLVFGQFLDGQNTPAEAVAAYFKFVRDYLMLVGLPYQVADWELQIEYWNFMHRALDRSPNPVSLEQIHLPLAALADTTNYSFLDPSYHEGVDLHPHTNIQQAPTMQHPVQLALAGQCIFTGQVNGCCQGKSAIFRHHLDNGMQILTVYGHLHSLENITPGNFYPQSAQIGKITSQDKIHQPYLHYALGYGATWENHLRERQDVPLTAGTSWIQARYLHPMTHQEEETSKAPGGGYIPQSW